MNRSSGIIDIFLFILVVVVLYSTIGVMGYSDYTNEQKASKYENLHYQQQEEEEILRNLISSLENNLKSERNEINQLVEENFDLRQQIGQVITENYRNNQYFAIHNFLATMYTAGPESTGKTPEHPEYGITFSGNRVKDWYTIATDPLIIPLGSVVYIPQFKNMPNNGIFVAEDIGSAIKGKKIDIYNSDLRVASNFKKNLDVVVLYYYNERGDY